MLPNCVSTPPVSHTDFEQYIANETGNPLPVFGRKLFSCQVNTYAPVDHIPVPSDYVIGPEDEIDIQIWGMLNAQLALVVDRNGQIALPQVGVVNVAGLPYSQLNEALRSAVSKNYRNFKLNATLGQLRSIQVYVFGNVNQPGVYTIGSLSTLVNAIFAAGGPSQEGSMRHLQLRRAGKNISDFDLYDLAVFGDKSHDVKLLSGDVVFVPPVGPQVALMGNLNMPGIYELRDKTSLSEILRYAGGLTQLASSESILLEHIVDHHRTMDQISLNDQTLEHPIIGGDIVRVFPISPEIHQSVTLRGNVLTPRRFLWHDGMRISDLIPEREMLITRNFWHMKNDSTELGENALGDDPWTAGKWNPFPRSLVDPMKKSPEDSAIVPVYGNGQFSPPDPQAAGLAAQTQQQTAPFNQAMPGIQNPGASVNQAMAGNQSTTTSLTSTLSPNTTMAAANGQTNASSVPSTTNAFGSTGTPGPPPFDFLSELRQNTAEINWDYAVIERLDKHDLTTHLIPFSLAHALDDVTSSDNQMIQAGDVVTIFGRKDIPLPVSKHTCMVQVAGEVNVPGVYRVAPGESLAEVLRKAGGLTKDAYLFGLALTRVSTKELQQQQLNASIEQMRRDLIANYTNSAALRTNLSASPKDGTDVLLTSEQGLLDQLSTLQATGRVVLNVKREAKQIEDLPEFSLEDGDSVTIPSRLNTVQVVGAVFNQTAFRYVQGKTVKEYLHDAGGSSRDADTGHMYLLEADGSIINNHSKKYLGGIGHMQLMPGDAIVVPLRFRSQNPFWQTLAPVTSVLSQSAVTGAVVANYMK